MKNSSMEKWVWVLIYGGLLVLSLGLFVRRRDGGFGALLLLAGTAATAAGAFLIWLRSHRGP